MIELTENEYQNLESVMDAITGRLATDRDRWKAEAERVQGELIKLRERSAFAYRDTTLVGLVVFKNLEVHAVTAVGGSECQAILNKARASSLAKVFVIADVWVQIEGELDKHGVDVEKCSSYAEMISAVYAFRIKTVQADISKVESDAMSKSAVKLVEDLFGEGQPNPGPDHIFVNKIRDRFDDHRHHAEVFSLGRWAPAGGTNFGCWGNGKHHYRIPKGPHGDHRHWLARPPLPHENGLAWICDGEVIYIVQDAHDVTHPEGFFWMPYLPDDYRPDPPATA